MNKYLFIPLFLLGLAACAPISEKQCAAGDWYGLGVRDGANGQADSRVLKYEEECAKIGVRVDRNEWFKGREEGLKQYCTIANAEDLGREGRSLRPVCPNVTALQPAWRHGLEYFKLTEKLDHLKDERDDLRDILVSMSGTELTREQENLRRRYMRRLRNVENGIDDIRHEIRLFRPYLS